jgi:SpoVK/Ycf46/Vps4 family AAA+-type ATPase
MFDGLEDMTFSEDSFNSLILPIGHKEALRAMVTSRLKRSHDNVKRSRDTKHPDYRIKERGQVILLHGVAGVGKTTTAICVADLMQKPLLPITTAQLSESPDNIEYRLDNSFQLARRWEAILLWEDADIFLASCTSSDPTRNSIATTAMRFLETYKGIVFLTTNRVHASDDTFISRINQSLYYPSLPRDNQLSIFKDLLKVAVVEDILEIMEYLRRALKDSKEGAMNGQEIRNAVVYAQDLAYYDRVRLGWQHFMAVFRTKGQLRSDREAEVQLAHKREGEMNLFRKARF